MFMLLDFIHLCLQYAFENKNVSYYWLSRVSHSICGSKAMIGEIWQLV
jgi:hypothetical protein